MNKATFYTHADNAKEIEKLIRRVMDENFASKGGVGSLFDDEPIDGLGVPNYRITVELVE